MTGEVCQLSTFDKFHTKRAMLASTFVVFVTSILIASGFGQKSSGYLNQPYLLGDPSQNSGDKGNFEFNNGPILSPEVLEIQGKPGTYSPTNDDIVKPLKPTWPGRQSPRKPLKNSGTDVVLNFKTNLLNYLAKRNTVLDTINQTKLPQCGCHLIEEKFMKYKCLLDCYTRGKGSLEMASSLILAGIKKYCKSLNTVYSKMETVPVSSLDMFFEFVSGLSSSKPVSANIPLTSMITKMIKSLKSPLNVLRPTVNALQNDLSDVEKLLGISDTLIITGHPGCAMIDLERHITRIMKTLEKLPEVIDHLLFQGYSLFTSLNKYTGEFASKSDFSVLSFGLETMLGTSCGIFDYGEKGQIQDCDQIGGFPVLNMPIPEFMWNEGVEEKCQDTKAKLNERRQATMRSI